MNGRSTGKPISNEYSRRWFATFLDTVPADRTRREVSFLRRHLPLDRYPRILDLACGAGRHANALAERGYSVTGVDLDPDVLELARGGAGENATFVEADMRDLGHVGERFDAAVCLWQSFGYFDSRTNRAVLREVHSCLRPRGRLILDIYNRRFFESRQGTRTSVRNGIEIEERKELTDGRLSVHLRYGDTGDEDRFEWEVFTAEEIAALAAGEGFERALSCSRFDETRDVSDDCARMQVIFDRAS